jgi:hypothetical protein
MAKFTYNLWDAKYNRPIVGDNVINPATGEVETAGDMVMAGPPSIDAVWINLDSSADWKSVGAPLHCPIDKALCEVGKHIQNGVYSIISLNASAYSLTVVCKSGAESEEFRKVLRSMREDLDESIPK